MDTVMAFLSNVWNFLTNGIFFPIWNGCVGLWEQVIIPAGSSVVAWFQQYLPWFTDFVTLSTKLLTLKYQIRIYVFAIMLVMLPTVLLLAVLAGLSGKHKRKERMRHAKN